MMIRCWFIPVFFLLFAVSSSAQDPQRFAQEIGQLLQQPQKSTNKPLLLFTGSSSIRMWRDLPNYFPDHEVLNMGFGGSQMSDLLFYLDDLVIARQPDQVFLYEGDNDIAEGKKVRRIMRDTRRLLRRLRRALPDVPVVLIAAKPSPARWSLQPGYEKLNKRFSRMATRKANVTFADIWPVMLNEQGVPEPSIFIEDQLHMNAAGYDLWMEVLSPLVKSKL